MSAGCVKRFQSNQVQPGQNAVDCAKTTRPYQIPCKKLAETLRQSLDRSLQLKEVRNDVEKLQALLVNSEKDLAVAELAKKTTLSSIAVVETEMKA